MKKKKLENLKLNKRTISSLYVKQIRGGQGEEEDYPTEKTGLSHVSRCPAC
ncbi:hypothetical protein [Sinomicrobium sp. M5D2P9]